LSVSFLRPHACNAGLKTAQPGRMFPAGLFLFIFFVLFCFVAVVCLRILRLSGNGIDPVPAPALQSMIFALFLFALFVQRDHLFHVLNYLLRIAMEYAGRVRMPEVREASPSEA